MNERKDLKEKGRTEQQQMAMPLMIKSKLGAMARQMAMP